MQRKIQGIKRAVLFLLLAVLITAGGVGCASKKDKKTLEERKAIIDDYASVFLPQDQDSARFDEALAAVETYLDNQTPEQKAQVQALVEEIIQQLLSDGNDWEPYEPSEKFKQMLENQGISLEEYQINADSRYTCLQGFVQDLVYLQEFLEYADEGDIFMEDLEMVCYLMTEEQKHIRGYSYAGVNYWFAGWGEDEVAYVRQQVLEKLVSFTADEESQWLDNREAVEARMNSYLDRLEELDDIWAAYIGESKEEVEQMKE